METTIKNVYIVKITTTLDSRDYDLPCDKCFIDEDNAKAYLKSVYDEWSAKIDCDRKVLREDLCYACLWDNPTNFGGTYYYENFDFKIQIVPYKIEDGDYGKEN